MISIGRSLKQGGDNELREMSGTHGSGKNNR